MRKVVPKPDPNAPVCPKCKEKGERKRIRRGVSMVHAVMVGGGTFHDEEGRKHTHRGSAGGRQTYHCACGHTWSEGYGSKLFPCWCGWGSKSKP